MTFRRVMIVPIWETKHDIIDNFIAESGAVLNEGKNNR